LLRVEVVEGRSVKERLLSRAALNNLNPQQSQLNSTLNNLNNPAAKVGCKPSKNDHLLRKVQYRWYFFVKTPDVCPLLLSDIVNAKWF